MSSITPGFIRRVIDKDTGEIIQFHTLRASTILALIFSAVLMFPVYELGPGMMQGKIGNTVIVFIFGFFAVGGLVFSIPRSLILDLQNGKYETSAGIGPLSKRRFGRLDEITAVYVRGQVNVNVRDAVNTYTLGLAFCELPRKPSLFTLRLPMCDVAYIRGSGSTEMWNYATELAARLNVPCVSIGWTSPS